MFLSPSLYIGYAHIVCGKILVDSDLCLSGGRNFIRNDFKGDFPSLNHSAGKYVKSCI